MNEVELLFTEILHCNKADLYLNRGLPIDQAKSRQISSALERRIKGEPIQYILRKTEFMGLDFVVDRNVLIPRPETEILVETVLDLGRRLWAVGDRPRILDMGTGSGCIAVSLAKLLNNVKVTAIDISEKALRIAKENARLNNVEIEFMQGDLFDAYGLQPISYDLIVSNPPYIPGKDIDNLQPQIQYEPRIALNGGEDGLDFYRQIIKESAGFMRKGGFLIMEMGFEQCAKIREIFKLQGGFDIINIVRDYNNIERVAVARYG